MDNLRSTLLNRLQTLVVEGVSWSELNATVDLRLGEGGQATLILESQAWTAQTHAAWKAAIDKVLSEVEASPPANGPITLVMGGATAQPAAATSKARKLPGVHAIVAVASGKGGVGKSTTAVNLALALQQLGLNVGILDGDIHGPSLPLMLKLATKPEVTADKRLIPLEAYGVQCMSLGLMMASGAPVIWRGLMVQSAMKQLLNDVAWGPLDVLVVDMPPGTGDAHITLLQSVVVDGAVIVATPQDLALIDAMRALNLYRRMNVPILGMVENMSQFVCPNCGHEEPIFSCGGVAREAKEVGVPILAEIPLDRSLRQGGDEGVPFMATAMTGPVRAAFETLAVRVRTSLGL